MCRPRSPSIWAWHKQINRIWLLPPASPALFPEAFQLDTSAEGAAWSAVALVERDALNQRQNPRTFVFTARLARYVRFTALRMRANPAGQFQVGLNGLRVSLSGSN